MPLLPQEFRDNLLDIANDLQGNNCHRVLKRNLSPALNQVEKDKTIIACELIISFLQSREKEEFIKGKIELERIRKEFRRLSKDGTLNNKDSITYADLPESTFYKKVHDMKKEMGEDYFKDENGKNRYKIDDLNKFARLIIDSSDSSKSALCIESLYLFDNIRQGYVLFSGGNYYQIVEENKGFKYVFNERRNVSLRISNIRFERHFRIKEDLEFDSHKLDVNKLRLFP